MKATISIEEVNLLLEQYLKEKALLQTEEGSFTLCEAHFSKEAVLQTTFLDGTKKETKTFFVENYALDEQTNKLYFALNSTTYVQIRRLLS